MRKDQYDFVGHEKYIHPDCNVIVVIDPGHGGMVNGEYDTAPYKMYDHGDFVFYEGVYNRDIALRLADRLEKNGLSYAFSTVTNLDESLNLRVNRANNLHRKYSKRNYVYFLSLHGNAFGDNNVNGVQVHTSPGVTDSDYIANYYYKSLENLGWRMRPNKLEDQEYDKENKFYVLTKTVCPAILTETGFFTNKEEARRMMDAEWQDKIVDCLLKAHQDIVFKIKRDDSIR